MVSPPKWLACTWLSTSRFGDWPRQPPTPSQTNKTWKHWSSRGKCPLQFQGLWRPLKVGSRQSRGSDVPPMEPMEFQRFRTPRLVLDHVLIEDGAPQNPHRPRRGDQVDLPEERHATHPQTGFILKQSPTGHHNCHHLKQPECPVESQTSP